MGETISKETQEKGDSDLGPSSSSSSSPAQYSSRVVEATCRGQTDAVIKLLKKGKSVDEKDEKGETALHKASIHGHYEIMNLLLSKGAEANIKNNDGFTPFHFAVMHGRKDCAKLLLTHGADINSKFTTNPGVSLGYSLNTSSGVYIWRVENFSTISDKRVYSDTFAISGRKWKLVIYPHGSKGDDNLSVYLEVADHETLPEGWSHLASFSFAVINQNDGSKKIVREVIAHRFYKNHTDLGFPQLVKKSLLRDKKSGFLLNDTLLIEFQVDIIDNTTYGLDEFSGTSTWKMGEVAALKERVTSGAFKIGGCKWMIVVYPRGKGGGNNLSVYLKVTNTNEMQNTSWFYLANFRFSVINQKDGSKFSRQVESKNFRPKVEDWGFPQFMKLSVLYDPASGFIEHDSLLVEVQVEITSETRRWKQKGTKLTPTDCAFTPLHWAAYKGVADGVKLLLERGAAVNSVDAKSRTPLDWTAYLGNASISELLIAAGANVNSKDLEGFSPLHKAIINGHMELAEALLAAGADVNAQSLNGTTPVQLAIYISNIDHAARLVQNHGADINCHDKYGRTPLHWAAFHGDMELMVLLLKLGAKINCADNDGYHPIHKAVWKGKVDCMKFILDHGGSVSCRSARGYTPLHTAVINNEMECTSILLEHGADVNCYDEDGFSPIHQAVGNGHLRMVDLLLLWKVNVNCTSAGITPLQIAVANNDVPTTVYLLQRGADVNGFTGTLLRFAIGNTARIEPDDLEIPANMLSRDLATLVNHPQYHDVTFLVEGQQVYAWRGILCARSDYFRAMFEQVSWRESKSPEVEVTQISHHTFLAVITFMYTGEIDPSLLLDDALQLLSAANRYILPRLKMLCERVIVRELNVDTVCSIFRLADLYQASFLTKACVQFLAEHYGEVSDLDDMIKSDTFVSCIISFLKT